MKIKWVHNVTLPTNAAHPLIWLFAATLPAFFLILTNMHLYATFESALSKEGKSTALLLFFFLSLICCILLHRGHLPLSQKKGCTLLPYCLHASLRFSISCSFLALSIRLLLPGSTPGLSVPILSSIISLRCWSRLFFIRLCALQRFRFP